MRTENFEAGMSSPRKRPLSSTTRNGSPPSQGLESLTKMTRAESGGAVVSSSSTERMRGDCRVAHAVARQAPRRHAARAVLANGVRSVGTRLLRQLAEPCDKGVGLHQTRDGSTDRPARVEADRRSDRQIVEERA